MRVRHTLASILSSTPGAGVWYEEGEDAGVVAVLCDSENRELPYPGDSSGRRVAAWGVDTENARERLSYAILTWKAES